MWQRESRNMALAIRDEVIEELLQGYRSPEDLLGEEGLFKELKKRLLERALGAELTEHLGYENRAPPPGSASETNTICQTKSKLLHIIDHSQSSFNRVTLAPIRTGKSPAHLDRGREGRLVRNPIQTDRTDQTDLASKLNRPLAEAVFVAMCLHLRDPGITRGPVHGQKHLHNNRVSGHSGKQLAIIVTPFAEQEARRS